MSTVMNIGSLSSPTYTSQPPKVHHSGLSAEDSTPTDQTDSVELSTSGARDTAETGRVALNVAAGNLTSDQATQLYQQIASIQSQIAADKQADGGTLSINDAQTIAQLQSQLSGTIYTDAHNGAAPPSDPPTVSGANVREAMQAGRIEMNLQAGNLTASQAQQLGAQQAQIDQTIAADQQANGGSLTQSQAQAIEQLQSQASSQIYQMVHPSQS